MRTIIMLLLIVLLTTTVAAKDDGSCTYDGCGAEELECEGADYEYDVDLLVVGEGCSSGQKHDSQRIDHPEAGDFRVIAQVGRSGPDQSQAAEDFTLKINGERGPEVLDRPGDEVLRLQFAGEFSFVEGRNRIRMDTAAECPPDRTANSVVVSKLCLYEVEPECGNRIVETGEECDGSAPAGYTCSDRCTLERDLCEDAVVLDFDDLDEGEWVTSYNGITVAATHGGSGPDKAIVFDSADPTGGDDDLGTPNEDFGGPGEGSGPGAGEGNTVALGNILIIPEDDVDGNNDDLVDDPDDTADGGIISFDFPQKYLVDVVTIVDLEEGGAVKVDAVTTPIPSNGDNAVARIIVEEEGESMEVRLGGSGAVGEIILCPVDEPICGDGVVEGEEICDLGDDNGEVCTPGYNSHCEWCTDRCMPAKERGPFCGDDIVNGPEECDGSAPPGYTCTDRCKLTRDPFCGDGNLDSGELCDLGGQNGVMCVPEYNSSCEWCTSECRPAEEHGPFCGDNITNGREECDGSAPEGYTCTEECTLEKVPYDYQCEDGILHLDVTPKSSSLLSLIDPTTGVGELKLIYPEKLSFTLAADDAGTIYSIRGKGSRDLVILEADGTITTVGPTGLPGTSVTLGFAPDGTLYVLDQDTDALYSVNELNGLSTLLHSFDDLDVSGGDLVVTEDNTLVYTRIDGSVYTVDLTTYDVTLVGNLPAGSYTSSAYLEGTHYALERTSDGLHTFTLGPFVNGLVEEGEAIISYGDATTCPAEERKPFCGDGILQDDEECDGSAPLGYVCNEFCMLEKLPYCGDGEVNNVGEECDDGNRYSNDGCNSVCQLEYCGDGILQPALEQCDYALPAPDGFRCTLDCELVNGQTFCGDGILQSPNQAGTGGPSNDGFEACDGDEGVGEHESCTVDCTVEQLPYCGDGMVNSDELCDLGGDNGVMCVPEYNSSCEWCTSECQPAEEHGPFCGDGIQNGEEQCDGNDGLEPGFGCTAMCELTALCDTDQTTHTQGGWGSPAAGDNPGTYRDANFDAAFPSGLRIGTLGGNSVLFTSSGAIESFLPAGGTPGALDDNETDPASTEGGVLAGQAVALSLNVGFDNFDEDFGGSPTALAQLVVRDESSACNGMTVSAVLDAANELLSDAPSIFTPSELNDCVTAINENFNGGNNEFLGCPENGFCGDGFINNVGEECDDKNHVSNDGCNAVCQLEYCGDGIVQPGIGEQCEEDTDGYTCEECLFVEIPEPGVELNLAPESPLENEYHFVCEPEGFSPTSYTWDFGDGDGDVTAENHVFHQYVENGDFLVTCTASDGETTREAELLVSPDACHEYIVEFAAPEKVAPGEEVVLRGSLAMSSASGDLSGETLSVNGEQVSVLLNEWTTVVKAPTSDALVVAAEYKTACNVITEVQEIPVVELVKAAVAEPIFRSGGGGGGGSIPAKEESLPVVELPVERMFTADAPLLAESPAPKTEEKAPAPVEVQKQQTEVMQVILEEPTEEPFWAAAPLLLTLLLFLVYTRGER